MHKWYVLQVMSGHERKVKKALQENAANQGFAASLPEILVPTENVSEVKKGEQKISEKRLWPGYIMIKADLSDEVWHCIKNTNGVIGFLGGGAPTPLTESEVQNILRDLEEKQQSVVHKHKVEVGDHVKITDGVFVNFIGVVQEVFHDKGRLSVMVSIFGRDTRVDDLEFWQVEEVNAESQG